MMAKREQIEVLFSTLRIRNEDTLIVYDDRNECDAALFVVDIKKLRF